MNALLTCVQLLAVWVIVPLGLRLVPGLPAAIRRTQPLGATCATAGLLLPSGQVAAGYAAWCLTAAGYGVVLLARRNPAPAVALLSLPVAALGMVASTGGWPLFGFELVLLTLTSVHFHFAGFGAGLIAGRTARALDRRWADVALAAVLVSPAIIGFAFFVSPAAQLPGVITLSAGVTVLAVAHLRTRPGWLHTISAVSVLVPMVLAVWWTTGLAFDVPHLSMTWTAATHGVTNALGYTLCGLLGWARTRATAPGTPESRPARASTREASAP
jgi:YndJ-like protein